MLAKVKSGVKRRIKKARQKIGGVTHPRDEFNAIHKRLLGDARTIFDVGAHRGETIDRFSAIFPNAKIHCFEADTENFEALKKKYGGRDKVLLNNFGAGSEPSVKTFHRNAKSDTSSFHELDTSSPWAQIRSREHNIDAAHFTKKSYDVQIRTLDSYIQEHAIERINLLKIDTQGYEDEVLKGCKKSLQAGIIDIIETELIIGKIYKRSLTFSDIEALLLPYGYKFHAIDRGGNLEVLGATAFNLIYISPSIYDK